ncbi:Zinc finger, C3HC4 RING-type [Dillenia turbinata]|uniref:E3 ubiquitin-protein ligase RMA n=1 Tax=Dillenia turbinata TaxID=194707 RepID=A0AAN8VVZ3_9MAGN
MADGTDDVMNLDLNLGPLVSPSNETEPQPAILSGESINLEDWIDEPSVQPRLRDAMRRIRQQARQRWRWRQQFHIPLETRNISMELMINSDGIGGASGGNTADGGGGGLMQTGEGSAVADQRTAEVQKTCENNSLDLESDALGKKEDAEKGGGNEGSFFDCNICLDIARDPVLTCCGHLFCWPCLYRWLHIHSDAKECPVCKGEVTIKNVTPIYGRGNSSHEVEDDSGHKIPSRPQARRVESLRRTIQRTARFSFPMEEMIRQIGGRFDFSRDLNLSQESEGIRDPTERTTSLLSRILTSRGMRREQSAVVPPDEVVDLTHIGTTSPEPVETRRFPPLLLRRSQSHRPAFLSSLSSALGSDEHSIERYFLNNPVGRNQEQPPPVEDRDSVSSIAAGIHSESQTMDTAVEIDSMVSLSTSTSRRRNDVVRVSDVDSVDSRAPRRRRLH